MGVPYGARSWAGPFEKGPQLLPAGLVNGKQIRHSEVHLQDNHLHILFTRMGDQPERIFHCYANIAGNWMGWQTTPAQTILKPECHWEGRNLPPSNSIMGGLDHMEQGLRDPCIFVDRDGQIYLLYVGGGEAAIGLARLTFTS